jgi:hypothetical protein
MDGWMDLGGMMDGWMAIDRSIDRSIDRLLGLKNK